MVFRLDSPRSVVGSKKAEDDPATVGRYRGNARDPIRSAARKMRKAEGEKSSVHLENLRQGSSGKQEIRFKLEIGFLAAPSMARLDALVRKVPTLSLGPMFQQNFCHI